MPTQTERTHAQALYLEVLHARAKAIYEMQKATLPIDPQGRVLLDVTLTNEDWEKIYRTNQQLGNGPLSVPFNLEMFQKGFITQLSHPITNVTTISMDLQTGSKEALNAKLAEGLKKYLPEKTSKDILDKYQGLAKGRIISLQQETHFSTLAIFA